MLTLPARLLGDSDRSSVQRLLDRDPYAGVQVAEQISTYGLAWWRTDARVFGYGPPRALESVCWLVNNLIPVHASGPAVAAFDFDGTLSRRDSLLPFLVFVRGAAATARAVVAEGPRFGRVLLGTASRDEAKAA